MCRVSCGLWLVAFEIPLGDLGVSAGCRQTPPLNSLGIPTSRLDHIISPWQFQTEWPSLEERTYA